MRVDSIGRKRAPGRAHVCNLFLRLLGVVFLIAFLSLLSQVTLLFGEAGLLPAQRYLATIGATHGLLDAPTVFWLSCSDTMLRAAAVAGAVLSFGLILNLAPRYCVLALWVLYLSFVTIGQDFLSFQWDNLLLESAFFALFVTPRGWRPKDRPSPAPFAILLMQWLVFRVHVESGAAKLLSGDPMWRDLTAMVSYYETAPLPTWLGWYAHQMPVWAHKLCALFTFLVELVVPFFIWGPRRFRVPAFVLMIAMQVSVILTANYGFFNYLTMALCLFVLDDGHLMWIAERVGYTLRPASARRDGSLRRLVGALLLIIVLPVSVVPFLPFVNPVAYRQTLPVRRVLNVFRSINAYHLFANMTLVRREPVIEGSEDGEHWETYEFRDKPGDPDRAPRFVAPHQPRVDFQLWFLLLGGRPAAPYFDALLLRLFEAPRVVAPLFARDPFPEQPPKFVRVAAYRYRFTDAATRYATGAWWSRERLGQSQLLTAQSLRGR
ncbi:MAG: lipase maturation factor family protein [Candidatus Binatia bacterium]